jgi:hypothetical protein
MPTLTNLPIVTTATGNMIFPVVDGTTTKQLSINNLKNYVAGASAVTSVNGKAGTVVLTATNISGFATVAISGSYNDLTNKPQEFSLNTATTDTLGGVKIGDNINVSGDGTISINDPFSLNTATTDTLGGVKGGDNISISSSGTISFVGGLIAESVFIDDETNAALIDNDIAPASGALVVVGGVVVGENVIVLNTLTAANVISNSIEVVEVSSTATLQLAAEDRVEISQSVFQVWNVDTSTRDTIVASNGDIIYNIGNNKFQGYANGIWVDLN